MNKLETWFVGRHPELNLSPKLPYMYVIYLCYYCIVGLCSTFINFLILKVNGKMEAVIVYNLFIQLSRPFFFALAGYIIKKHSKVLVLRMGVSSYMLFLLIALVSGKSLAAYSWLMGLIVGFAHGCFFISYNTLIMEYTEDYNRRYACSITAVITYFSTLMTPLMSSLIVYKYTKENKGYAIVFTIALIINIISSITSFKIKKDVSEESYNIREVFDSVIKSKDTKLVFAAEFVRGIRDGVIIFLTNQLVYILTKNELLVGILSVVYFVITVTFSRIMRKINRENKWYFLSAGIVLINIAGFIVYFNLNIYTAVVFGLLGCFSTPIINSITTIAFNHISQNGNFDNGRVEGLVLREFVLAAGKVLGISMLLILKFSLQNCATVLLAVSLSQIALIFLYKKIQYL